MNPDSYNKIGKKITQIEFHPGFAFDLKCKKTKALVACDEQLDNPRICSEFKVKKIGKVQIGFEEGKPSLVLMPKLNKIDCNLAFNALENTFQFSYQRKLKAIKSLCTVAYDSQKKEASLLVQPKFKVNKIKFDASLLLKKPVEGCPPIIYQGHAEYKNIFLCTCFHEETKEFRVAAFAKLLKNVRAGVLAHIDPHQEKALKAIDLYGKLCFKQGKVGVIGTVLGETPVVKVNAKSKLAKKVKGGVNVVYDKAITADVGLKAKLKKVGLNLVYNLKQESDVLNHGLTAQTKFKVKNIGKAKLGVQVPTLVGQPEPHFSVLLKIKD